MSELSLKALANVDIAASFSAAYDWEPPAKRLASITPMLNEALGNFNILGFPLMLGVTFGLDISVGVKFSAKAALRFSVGADIVCNYKFGFYLGYDRPDQRRNGCQFNYHPVDFQVSGAIEVSPYVLLEPRVQVGFGNLLYGRAILEIKPTLVFHMAAQNTGPVAFSINLNLKIPFALKFAVGYDVSIAIISLKDEKRFGPYEIANLDFKLASFKINRPQSVAGVSTLAAGHESPVMSTLSVEDAAAPSCACLMRNDTIPWQSEFSKATLSTRTSTWQVMNGTLIDTCEFSEVSIDTTSQMFNVPESGYYEVIFTAADISPESESARWSAFARIGPDCCGRFVGCASVSKNRPTWRETMYFSAGDSISLVWASDAAGSDATITTSIVLDKEPVVYVDLYNGNSDGAGTRSDPIEHINDGLNILAQKVSPSVTSLTLVVRPTLPATNRWKIRMETTRYVLALPLSFVHISFLLLLMPVGPRASSSLTSSKMCH